MDGTCSQRNWASSRFNEYLGKLKEDRWVIYNNLSGAMTEVKEDIYRHLRSGHALNLEKPEYYIALERARFIIPGDLDEIEGLKNMKRGDEEAIKVIGLKILPTLNCQFGCTYCYQSKTPKTGSMSDNVMAAIISHVQSKIKPTTCYLNVMWFGGEPLLAMDKIQYLGRELLEISEKNNLQYYSGIITNGYLLSEKNTRILLEHHVTDCQVTIDGPERIHDKRRMLKNGGKTWRKIIDNVKTAVSMGMKISIRMNLDKTNISHIREFTEDLKAHRLFHTVPLSLGVVSSFGSACRSIDDQLLSTTQANDILKRDNIKDLFEEKGQRSDRAIPDFIGCVATARNSLIVGPDGEVYKCAKCIGDENEQCGTIFDIPENHPNFRKWITCSNLDVEQCIDCSMLPVCRGRGCAFNHVIRNENIFDCKKETCHDIHLNKLIDLHQQKQMSPNSKYIKGGK